METIFWILTICLFHKGGDGLSHHIRHERTRYVSGKNQIYGNDYSPNLQIEDYIPFIHYWERPLQLLESSMNVPKKLSSRPLFSWDMPNSPPKKFITTSENPVNDDSKLFSNLPGSVKTSDDKDNKIDTVAAARVYLSGSNSLNRGKDYEMIPSSRSITTKKKRKSNNRKKSIGDQNVKRLEEQVAQKDENVNNELASGRIRRKKKERKSKKGKMLRRSKFGKFNEVNSLDVMSSSRKKTEMSKSLKSKKTMEFIDEAKTTVPSKSPCEMMENKCEHKCDMINGTATCLCFKGFTPMGSKCVDINECEYNNGGCHGKCINTIGSSKCICSSGFRLVEGVCSDVNECLLRNGHGLCQDTCINTIGSYYCSCEGIPGSVLSSDKHTCKYSKECIAEEAGCSHSCFNTSGIAFCMCPDGLELGDDWKTCHDINECSNKEDYKVKCESGCINTIGSYVCADD